MSDSLTTKVDRTYLDDATRADASRYLIRTNNADLLVILGLALDPDAKRRRMKGLSPAEPALTVDGQRCCPKCREPLGKHRRTCRREGCAKGGAR